MQEIEKLKQLQSQRETLRKRTTEGEASKSRTEEMTKTVCPECGSRQLVQDNERAELVSRTVVLCLMMKSLTAAPNGVRSTMTSG